MRVPEALESLVDHGIIQDVVRPLLAGKEAQIYLVTAGGQQCVAKVYKSASERSFRHRVEYTEGRRVRNTRDQRALDGGSRYGKARQESAWRSAEVDVIYRLRAAGVRVPEPIDFVDGVLVMELIVDAAGRPAPRLGDLRLDAASATATFEGLVREVQKMLCAGVVHGDLSEFNVLVGATGPVVIDFPQAVDPTHNPSARRLLLRDVGNLTRFFGRAHEGLRNLRYAEELWDLYERRQLTPTTELTGRWQTTAARTDTRSLLDEIAAVERENRERRAALGLPVRPARQPRPAEDAAVAVQERPGASEGSRRRRTGSRGPGPKPGHRPGGPSGQARPPTRTESRPPQAARAANRPQQASEAQPPRRRRRRRRGKRGAGPGAPGSGPPR